MKIEWDFEVGPPWAGIIAAGVVVFIIAVAALVIRWVMALL